MSVKKFKSKISKKILELFKDNKEDLTDLLFEHVKPQMSKIVVEQMKNAVSYSAIENRLKQKADELIKYIKNDSKEAG
jgi:hypothetical protein